MDERDYKALNKDAQGNDIMDKKILDLLIEIDSINGHSKAGIFNDDLNDRLSTAIMWGLKLVKNNVALADVIVPLCECGGCERVALDCTMKPCKHPKYFKG